jgi:hypothetical protein
VRPIIVTEGIPAEVKSTIRKAIEEAIQFLGLQKSKTDLLVTLTPEAGIKNATRGAVRPDVEEGIVRFFIRPASFYAMAETIAHEMVHVAQYAHGVLTMYPHKGECIWKGQLFADIRDKLSGKDHAGYEALPWEIEARELAPMIMQQFERCKLIRKADPSEPKCNCGLPLSECVHK